MICQREQRLLRNSYDASPCCITLKIMRLYSFLGSTTWLVGGPSSSFSWALGWARVGAALLSFAGCRERPAWRSVLHHQVTIQPPRKGFQAPKSESKYACQITCAQNLTGDGAQTHRR